MGETWNSDSQFRVFLFWRMLWKTEDGSLRSQCEQKKKNGDNYTHRDPAATSLFPLLYNVRIDKFHSRNLVLALAEYQLHPDSRPVWHGTRAEQTLLWNRERTLPKAGESYSLYCGSHPECGDTSVFYLYIWMVMGYARLSCLQQSGKDRRDVAPAQSPVENYGTKLFSGK